MRQRSNVAFAHSIDRTHATSYVLEYSVAPPPSEILVIVRSNGMALGVVLCSGVRVTVASFAGPQRTVHYIFGDNVDIVLLDEQSTLR